MRHLFLLLSFLFPFVVIGEVTTSAADDTLPAGKGSRTLVFPYVIRSPETSWGGGLAAAYFFKAKKHDPDIRTSDLNLVSLFTFRKQIVIVLGSTVYFPGEKQILRFQSSYSYYPDRFWGLGNSTSEKSRENYTIQQYFFNPQLLQSIFKKMYLGLTYELQNVTDVAYSSGGVFDQQDIPGRNGSLTSGAGVLLTWDTRNNAYSPTKGFFAEVSATRFERFLGSDYKFSVYSVDLRKFHFAGRNRVLAGQAYFRLSDGTVPIRYLSMIGGSEMMRGYFKGRFSDMDMFTFQTELRQYLWWRVGIDGFASIGQVQSFVKEFSIDGFHVAYGGGVRIMLQEKEKLNLRVDFGFGKKSSGIYVVLKEAF